MRFIQLHVFVISILLSQLAFGQSPNILLIISDDLNTRIGPFMDLDNHTPNLDQLAKEGVTFTKAYCQYPLCGPSRASLMSGLYPETNGVLNNAYQTGSYKKANPALENHPSMAGFFREKGYFTARVSKIYHMGVPGGIENGDAGGDEPESWDYVYNIMGPETQSQGELELLSPLNLHYGGNFSRMIIANELEVTQTDYLATNQAIAILENRAGKLPSQGKNKQKPKPNAPFFLAVGYVRPHVPLIAPQYCYDNYPDDQAELPKVIINDLVPKEALRHQNEQLFGMSESQKQKTISAYMASVQFMDTQVGRLMTALDRLKLRDNTIVIFISDHGYNLGEHDCWSKVSLWEGSVRVPMIITAPGSLYKNKKGKTNNEIVELIDLYPTLTDLTGFADQQPGILQGKSLKNHLKNGEQRSSNDNFAYTISYQGKAFSIRTKKWRYTRWGREITEGNEELYNHQKDPEEHQNLTNKKSSFKTLEMMRNKLENAIRIANQQD